MKVVIPGGTGQVGTLLARNLSADGHDVVVLSRTPKPAAWRVVAWDAETVGEWAGELEGADAVVNLAGRSVNCRYHAENRRLILDSRVRSTHAVGRAIGKCLRAPRVWLQMSTATIYAHRYDAANDEFSGVLGGTEPDLPDTWRFSVDVAKAWEHAANEIETPHTRKVLLRTSIVMNPDRGSAFDTLLWLVRRGLGGANGGGRQFVSWIHDADFVRAVRFLIDRDDIAGPVNLASPNPLPNRAFMRELRKAWGAKFGLPATRVMLEIGARVLKTETELVLKSRRVVPGVLARSGFEFRFPEWNAAAADLCRRWRDGRKAASG